MGDVRQSLSQLITALATRELAAANLLNALAGKIGDVACRDADGIQMLTILKELTCETLSLTMQWDKIDLESLAKLLDRLTADATGD